MFVIITASQYRQIEVHIMLPSSENDVSAGSRRNWSGKRLFGIRSEDRVPTSY